MVYPYCDRITIRHLQGHPDPELMSTTEHSIHYIFTISLSSYDRYDQQEFTKPLIIDQGKKGYFSWTGPREINSAFARDNFVQVIKGSKTDLSHEGSKRSVSLFCLLVC